MFHEEIVNMLATEMWVLPHSSGNGYRLTPLSEIVFRIKDLYF